MHQEVTITVGDLFAYSEEPSLNLSRIRDSSGSFYRARNSPTRYHVQVERAASGICKSRPGRAPVVIMTSCCQAGEEQGLLGSLHYASESYPHVVHGNLDQMACDAGELRDQEANITLMAHSDMLAYHVEGEPPQLAFPKFVNPHIAAARTLTPNHRIGTQEVINLISLVASVYSPELVVGSAPVCVQTTRRQPLLTYNRQICCSDHMTFHERGFPAAQLFERGGPIADPMYHNSGKRST